MLKKIIFPILILLALQSCSNTATISKSYSSKRSKVEIISEEFVKKEKFQGNTNIDILYKNYNQLVFERNKKNDSSIIETKGGVIEISVNGASKEAVKLKNFQYSIITASKTIKLPKSEITTLKEPYFKKIDPEYNTELFQAVYKLAIKEDIKTQFKISISDNFVNKTTIAVIYPYYNK